jgi:hypothetical protein
MEKILPWMKVFAVFLIAATIAGACTKSGPTPLLGPSYLTDSSGTDTLTTYGVSFSYGGTATTYSNEAFAIDSGTIWGMEALSSNDSVEIAFEITSTAGLSTTITYTDTSMANNAVFVFGNPLSGAVIGATSYAANPNVKVNFTAITSTYVKGTFSGNIAPITGSPTTAITNGAFYLQVL